MTKYLAVIMSVYHGDKADWLNQSIQSVFSQTFKSFDFFLQVDGNIDDSLREVISFFEHKYQNFYVEFYPSQKGLAFQLNRSIDRANAQRRYDYFVRMDADDICDHQRFEKQISFFELNDSVSVLGTDTIEIDENGQEIFNKHMRGSHEEILKYIIKRCPVSHPTVMIKGSIFQDVSNRYNFRLKNTQDYFLWVDLIYKGYVFANLNEPLLYFRISKDFYSRRGFKKCFNEFYSRLYAMKKLKKISLSNIGFTVALFIMRLSPRYIKKIAYLKLR